MDLADKNQLRQTIDLKLVETGEKDRLKEILRHRLIQSGWRDDLKMYCKEIVTSKGLEKVTVDDLVKEITPKARAMVPETVKQELLIKIRKILSESE